jgi:DMSO/TMAO reductase YedYZ molybdopterin-dependent catalytic subunit
MRSRGLGRVGQGRLADALTSIAGGVLASLAAAAVMLLMRLALQVRSVPERVLEVMLLVTPPDLFEAALLRYGFDAKRYALSLTIVVTLLCLTGSGAWAIGRRWSVGRVVSLSFVLWLFVMVVIMPLTDAGPFGIGLINGKKAAIGAHLAVALVYAAALALAITDARRAKAAAAQGSVHAPQSGPGGSMVAAVQPAAMPSRRAALILGVGAVSSVLGAYAAARWGPRVMPTTRVVVLEPERVRANRAAEAALSQPIPTPGRAPDLATRPVAMAQPTTAPSPTTPPLTTPPPTMVAVPTATSTPQVQPQPTPTAPPSKEFEPPPVKQLARDKDGLVLPSGRRPGQLADAITPTDDFYIVSKNAAQDPFIELDGWRLRVDGEVHRPIEIDYRSLRNLPPVEVTKTLQCISNFVTKCELAPFGCDLISTATWKGTRVRDILTLAGGLTPGVTSLMAVAADDFTTALPIEAALDPDTLLVYEMNGQPLSREHGYPARILVPGRYGMKNAKWVIALRPLGREADDWYGQRSWSKHAIVKTMTRIDTPVRDAELPPGRHRIAGIAYAGERGIQKVELSADGGEQWQVADLIDRPAGRDVWVRWEGSFTLAPGATVTLMARATDGANELQSEPFSLPQPDGSSGWHSLEIRAASA